MNKVETKPHPALFPVPVVMVTVGDKQKQDIVTLAWVGMVCSEPPIVSISIRPSRYSHEILSETGDFIINVPTADMVEKLDYCGTVSGRDFDKFSAADLTPVPASHVQAPRIHECPVNIECKVVNRFDLGSHTVFFGEMLAVHIDKRAVDERNRVDYAKIRPICYCPEQYWSLGEMIGTYAFTKKEGV